MSVLLHRQDRFANATRSFMMVYRNTSALPLRHQIKDRRLLHASRDVRLSVSSGGRISVRASRTIQTCRDKHRNRSKAQKRMQGEWWNSSIEIGFSEKRWGQQWSFGGWESIIESSCLASTKSKVIHPRHSWPSASQDLTTDVRWSSGVMCMARSHTESDIRLERDNFIDQRRNLKEPSTKIEWRPMLGWFRSNFCLSDIETVLSLLWKTG